MCRRGGADSEGGTLAAVGGQASGHGHRLRARAGAGEEAAQQRGTVVSRLVTDCSVNSKLTVDCFSGKPQQCVPCRVCLRSADFNVTLDSGSTTLDGAPDVFAPKINN